MSRLELLITPPQRIETPTSSQIPYDYHEIRSAFDDRLDWFHDNVRSSISGTLGRIAELLRHQRSGRRNGDTAPNIRSVVNAMRWVDRMHEDVRLLASNWVEPLVTVDEFGDVVFEWWHGSRKITVYALPESVEYIKVGGPDIHSDMEDGELRTRQDHQNLWRWLTSGD